MGSYDATGRQVYFFAARLEPGAAVPDAFSSLALSATFPLIFSVSSAAPAIAPSAAPAAALVNTAFNASLALLSNPVDCFRDDFRLPVFLVAPRLLPAFLEALFLVADFFELPFEADLVDFPPAGFLAGMVLLVFTKNPQEATLPQMRKKRCLLWTMLWRRRQGPLRNRRKRQRGFYPVQTTNQTAPFHRQRPCRATV
ncbi:MAG TPA: hypothetical protein VIW64_00775 [Pyrinomonadaceae bacterium]